jgi:hypothetical protein
MIGNSPIHAVGGQPGTHQEVPCEGRSDAVRHLGGHALRAFGRASGHTAPATSSVPRPSKEDAKPTVACAGQEGCTRFESLALHSRARC